MLHISFLTHKGSATSAAPWNLLCDSKPLMSNKMEADLEQGVTLSVPLIGSDIVLNAADGGEGGKGKAENA